MKFHPASDQESCPLVIDNPRHGPLACMRIKGHVPPCITTMGAAAKADGVCWECRALIDQPHRSDCHLGDRVTNIDEIQKLQAELNALDTQLGTLIRSVAEAMRAHLSIRVEVELSGDENCDYLAFGKLNATWQLIYIRSGGVEMPLLDAPRDIRASVFVDGHVHRLVSAARETLYDELEQRRTAIARAEALIATLAQPPKP